MKAGDKIRRARKAKKMTQTELGELLGVDKSTIARYEGGGITNLKRSTLKRIAAILDISPAELVGDYKKEKPVEDDGLSKGMRELIEFAKKVPEDRVQLALKLMKSVVEDD